jgi:hypothetical protein
VPTKATVQHVAASESERALTYSDTTATTKSDDDGEPLSL